MRKVGICLGKPTTPNTNTQTHRHTHTAIHTQTYEHYTQRHDDQNTGNQTHLSELITCKRVKLASNVKVYQINSIPGPTVEVISNSYWLKAILFWLSEL